MSEYSHTEEKERRYGKIAVAGLLTASVGLLATAGVYAGLSATATGAESVTSGTFNLLVGADAPSAGFTNFTGKMAPGDTDNVYVNLKNTGTLDSAAGMTLAVTGAPSNFLTNGLLAGEGLTVTITQCNLSAWTAAGVCVGGTTSVLPTTQVSAMSGGVPLSTAALVALTGQVQHLQVSLGLTGTENSINGVPPANTIQGLSTTLTYSFTEQQRTGVATNQ